MRHVPLPELKYMISFFYTLDYDETGSCLLDTHARMYGLADQYEILNLGILALGKYKERCLLSWSLKEFSDSIKDIYDTTPESMQGLRQTVCSITRERLPRILKNNDAAELYEKTLDENPEFTKDLLASYVRNNLAGRCSSAYGSLSNAMQEMRTRKLCVVDRMISYMCNATEKPDLIPTCCFFSLQTLVAMYLGKQNVGRVHML
ncbi:hypothetical protein GQ44DRAFT_707845 [Phaeosphaeriaceae sp. PMI808]|nr:hypothetical protein GQ44DRAFT_707845 [Phaeosphaeriaceae sp. PMI808]